MGQVTKRQHYVPEFYFKNFYNCHKKVCDYELKYKSYSYKTAGQICYKPYLYEIPWEKNQGFLGDFVQTNSIENHFRDRETVYSPLISKVIDGLRDRGSLFLNVDELDVLSELVSNLFIRNPVVINLFNVDYLTEDDYQGEEVKKIDFLIKKTGVGELDPILKAAKFHELVDNTLNGSYLNIMKEFLKNMRLTFLIAQESRFITSNQPVSIKVDNKGNLQFLALPLSPQIALTYSLVGTKSNIISMPSSAVRSLNKMYLNNGRTDITNLYAQFKEDIEEVLRS